MFNNGFPKEWSTLRKLAWLYRTVINAVSAVLKTITGNPIHILDALAKPAQALSVKLEPIQDLHGYDNPWPAGGGKNKLAFPYAEDTKTNNGVTFTVNDDGTVRINGTATARGVFYLQNDVSNFHPDAGTYYVSKGSECQSATIIVEAYNGTTWKKNLATVATAVSVQFTIDYDGYDRVSSYISVSSGNSPSNEIVKPMFRLSSVTDATFAPYSNICPISGWTECKVTRTGVNVWDEEWENGRYDLTTGEKYAANTWIRNKTPIPCKGWETYYSFLSTDVSASISYWFYDGAGNFLSTIADKNRVTFTTPANAAYMNIAIWYSGGGVATYVVGTTSVNYPSTDTSYHAYVGTTYPFPLGQTVYGGTLDVVTGVLTVTHGTVSDFSNLNTNGQALSGAYRYRLVVSDCGSYSVGSCICSCLTYNVSFEYANEGEFYNSSGALNIYLSDADIVSAKKTLADNNCFIVYPLATPQTIQLTPTQVELLQGENNVSVTSEVGSVELSATYMAAEGA